MKKYFVLINGKKYKWDNYEDTQKKFNYFIG